MTLMIDRLDIGHLNADAPPEMYPPDLLSLHTPVFEITNVADLCYRMELFDKDDSGIVLNPEKFPNVSPPYRSYWMEWRCPSFLDSRRTIGRYGLWCVITDETDNDTWSLCCVVFINERKPEPIGHFQLQVTRAGHVFDPGRLTVYPDAVDAVLGALPTRAPEKFEKNDYIEDFKREIAGLSDEEARALGKLRVVEMDAKIKELDAEVIECRRRAAEARGRAAESLGDALRISVLPPLLMAHSLLGCKNVDTEDHAATDKAQRAAVKRRGQRLVKFVTLAIRPMGSKRGEGTRVQLGDGQTALHLVRGHFKTFTTERPLFGTRVGTYWWSPNVRGNAEHGVVVKDYEVRA